MSIFPAFCSLTNERLHPAKRMTKGRPPISAAGLSLSKNDQLMKKLCMTMGEPVGTQARLEWDGTPRKALRSKAYGQQSELLPCLPGKSNGLGFR